MIRRSAAVGLLAFALCWAAMAQRRVEDEVLIAWEPLKSMARSQVLGALETMGLRRIRAARGDDRPETWILPSGLTVESALAWLRTMPSVRIAEPNLIRHLVALTPNDPLFSPDQWQLDDPVNDFDLDAPEAWDLTTGSPGVVIAFIDTGIDSDHPDLAGNLWVNADEIAGNGLDDDGNGYVDDVHGYSFAENNGDPSSNTLHGTNIAGIAGMVGNNAVGGAGVCWDVSLMVLRVFDGSATLDDVIEAIDYATDNGADVISVSYGGFEFSGLEREAFARAGEAGVLVFAASGNDGIDIDRHPFYPASYELPNLLGVGASDQTNTLGGFSNWGRNTLHLLAPGAPITTTRPITVADPSGYTVVAGTSFASPHASGVAALVRSAIPTSASSEVIARILSGLDHPPGAEGASDTEGRLNAFGALLGSDDTSPAGISDLAAVVTESLGARVTFTAPGDDGMAGTPARWDVRIATMPLSESNWDSSPRAWDIPPPLSAGERAELSLSRLAGGSLEPNTTYHVGARAVDEIGNRGPISNACQFTTAGVSTILFDDFETDSGLWAADAPWQRTNLEPVASASHCFHDSVATSYATGEDIALTLASPLDFSQIAGAELRFATQWNFAQGAQLFRPTTTLEDQGLVEISTDGISWSAAERLHTSAFPYQRIRVPMGHWDGEPQVWIRFRLVSDSNTLVGDGWWIDDVHIFVPHVPLSSTPDIFVESQGPGQSATLLDTYVETGSGWMDTEAKSPLAGTEANHARAISSSGEATATFRPWISVDGIYEVAVTWGEGANGDGVTVRVDHADGIAEQLITQDGSSGTPHWTSLGTHRFSVGTQGALTLDASTVSGRPDAGSPLAVIADTARWRLIAPTDPTGVSLR